jgi:hypothetical protein
MLCVAFLSWSSKITFPWPCWHVKYLHLHMLSKRECFTFTYSFRCVIQFILCYVKTIFCLFLWLIFKKVFLQFWKWTDPLIFFQRIITKGRRRSFPRNSLVTSSDDDDPSVTSSICSPISLRPLLKWKRYYLKYIRRMLLQNAYNISLRVTESSQPR